MAVKPKRGKNKDNARRSKKKVSILTQEQVEYVDYKDINLLRRFMSDRAKSRARRVTGNNAQQQASVAKAIKNAREWRCSLPNRARAAWWLVVPRGIVVTSGLRADAPAPSPHRRPPKMPRPSSIDARVPEGRRLMRSILQPTCERRQEGRVVTSPTGSPGTTCFPRRSHDRPRKARNRHVHARAALRTPPSAARQKIANESPHHPGVGPAFFCLPRFALRAINTSDT